MDNSKLDYILTNLRPFVENIEYTTIDKLREKVKDKILNDNEFHALLKLLQSRQEIAWHIDKVAIRPEGLHKLQTGGYSKNKSKIKNILWDIFKILIGGTIGWLLKKYC